MSQIYLSCKKLDGIRHWFQPSLEHFEPVTVRDFLGNGELTLTDGHTRTFVAWQSGVARIPALYDESHIVTGPLGQMQYEHDITWCCRFRLRHIWDLSERILDEEGYRTLWMGRCDRMYDMVVALEEGRMDRTALEERRLALEREGLYVYGASPDGAVLYCEDASGALSEVWSDLISYSVYPS